MTTGENIRVLRNLSEMTQSRVCRVPGITKSKLARYEKDQAPLDIADRAKLAALFAVPNDAFDPNSETLRRFCKPDESLYELAIQFRHACHLNAYAALSAIDTVLFGNNPDIRDPNTTRFIPAVDHKAGYDNYFKHADYVRMLAGYSAMLQIEEDKNEFCRTYIDYNGRDSWPDMAKEAMLLIKIDEYDGDEFARCKKIIEFYTVFADIGLTNKMTFDEVHQKIANRIDI